MVDSVLLIHVRTVSPGPAAPCPPPPRRLPGPVHLLTCLLRVGRGGGPSLSGLALGPAPFLMTSLHLQSLPHVNLNCKKRPREATHWAPFSSRRAVNEQGAQRSFSSIIAREKEKKKKDCLPAPVFIKSNFASP